VKRSILVLGLGALVFALSANAQPEAANAQQEGLDGSEPLVCDLVEASECDGVAKCSDVTVEQINLPPVWQVDFAAKRLTSGDAQRTSPIKAVDVHDAVLVLQGYQNGHGWTMVIDRVTGHLSSSITGAEGAYMLAGACTAH